MRSSREDQIFAEVRSNERYGLMVSDFSNLELIEFARQVCGYLALAESSGTAGYDELVAAAYELGEFDPRLDGYGTEELEQLGRFFNCRYC